ncbi:hypothetical protein DOT66_14795 [Ralstonia pseudosolanacearum]|nr:hypothetical protein BC350_21875 [Ralstonia pseudosolanacearum]OHU99575.1 hypothetical protein BLA34_15775 [Ralstonia solanacearum]RAA08328.1 hypothetical protein DOT66_14795 [Ralstonia pseudosolanacearum]BCL89004.1 hypothetical protein MAFF211471_40870 [Ralstonia solanacearum]BCL94164.1 hypothetical protein MAFF211479_38650 [Ralstonia solanacearum]
MRGTAWRGREAKPARQPERRPRGVTDVAWAAVARPRDRAPACSCDPLGMPRAAAVMRRRGLDRWRDVIGTMRAVLMLTGAPRCRTFLDALGPQQTEGLYGRPMRHAAHSQP